MSLGLSTYAFLWRSSIRVEDPMSLVPHYAQRGITLTLRYIDGIAVG